MWEALQESKEEVVQLQTQMASANVMTKKRLRAYFAHRHQVFFSIFFSPILPTATRFVFLTLSFVVMTKKRLDACFAHGHHGFIYLFMHVFGCLGFQALLSLCPCISLYKGQKRPCIEARET